MTDDEVDELGRRLFASAQIERPSDELRARVLAAARSHRFSPFDRERSASVIRRRPATQRRSGWQTARWLLAAAALVALPLALRRRSHPEAVGTVIRAENPVQSARLAVLQPRPLPPVVPNHLARTHSASQINEPALLLPSPLPAAARPERGAPQPLSSSMPLGADAPAETTMKRISIVVGRRVRRALRARLAASTQIATAASSPVSLRAC